MYWNVLWKGIVANFEQAQSWSLNLNSTQQGGAGKKKKNNDNKQDLVLLITCNPLEYFQYPWSTMQ